MAESLRSFERGALGQNRELAILHSFSLALSRSYDADEILAVGIELLLRLLDLPAGSVHEALWDEGQLRLRTSQGLTAAGITCRREIPLEGTYLGEAARRDRTVVVPDLIHAARLLPLRDVDQEQGFQALASVPIHVNEEVWGVLTVLGREPLAFSPEQIQVLEAVSGQFGIALERALLVSKWAGTNAQLHALLEATEAGKRRLEMLTSVARSVTTTLNPAEVFRAVVQSVIDLFPGNMCSLWVVDGESLQVAAEAGLSEPRDQQITFRFGEGLVGVVAATRKPLIIADVREDARVIRREWMKHEEFVSYLGLPLLLGGRVQGVLDLFMRSAHHFPPEEVALLESFANQAVVAIDNARLFDEAHRRAQALSTLYEIGTALVSTLDVSAILDTIAGGALTLIGAHRAAVFELDVRDQCLYARATRGMRPDQPFMPIKMGQGAAGNAVLLRQPVFSPDVEAHPLPGYDEVWEETGLTLRDVVRRRGYRAILAVPLISKEAVLGALCIYWDEVHPYDEREVRLLTAMAQQAALALENARLYDETQKRARELQGLIRAGRTVSSSLEQKEVLEAIVRETAAVIPVEGCSLILLDPATGQLRWVADVGLPAAWGEEVPILVGEGLPGWVAAHGRPLAVLDLTQDPRTKRPDYWTRFGFVSFLGVPVEEGGRTIGVLTFHTRTRHEFTEGEIALACSFADQAAIALKNARLFEAAVSRSREMSSLYAVTSAASQSLNPDEILKQALERASEVLGFNGGMIFLLEGEGIRLGASHGLPPEFVARITRKRGEGLAAKAIRGGEPMWFEDMATDPRYLDLSRHQTSLTMGFRAQIFVPIVLSGAPIGALTLLHRTPHRFSEEEVQLLLAIAQQLAGAINNARLFQETQRAYEELAAAQEQLVQVEKLRALGEMASGVAHDFNNVLAAIIGRAQLLLQRIEDPELKQWVGVIEQAALDGAQTVRRIQEFTRISREQSRTATDAVQVVEDALEVTQPRWRDEAQSKGIEIRVEADLSPVPLVPGNPAEIREVLTNLILNALDAMPTGGTLTLRTRADERGVTMEVADTGIGMSDEVRRRAFDPFFTTKEPRGTGLGLAVAYGIVTRHGGEIRIESREGIGSTFTIHLPVGPVESPPVAARESAPVASARILVVDDEESVREVLRDILSLDHQVDEAASGAEGIERFQQGEFDLVFTDLGMAGISGWQVAKAVKALRPKTPVVLVTGWGVQLNPAELQAQGVARVLKKPFQLSEVSEIVASLLNPVSSPSCRGGPA